MVSTGVLRCQKVPKGSQRCIKVMYKNLCEGAQRCAQIPIGVQRSPKFPEGTQICPAAPNGNQRFLMLYKSIQMCQSYATTFDLLTHATTFVEHVTGYAWDACLVRKNAATMAEAVKALQAHVYRCKHRSVRYLWTGSDPTALSKSFTDFFTGEGILFEVSPPYQHEKTTRLIGYTSPS
jgi:hypothetical protein